MKRDYFYNTDPNTRPVISNAEKIRILREALKNEADAHKEWQNFHPDDWDMGDQIALDQARAALEQTK
jgi:hypothetical protein